MNVAFIPVRGGSKSIPLKNIKPINGQPLVYWVAKAASLCSYIDKVYIATDSDDIRQCVSSFNLDKVTVIDRSEESASDTASTESAMLEFANKYDFDNIVLIQATSPLLTADDLNRGFEAFNEEGVDSVLSTVRQKRFNWQINEKGYAYPTNYDVFKRPRRQEFAGYLVENGAFYITSKKDLLKTKNRISGNIKAVEMNEDTFFEIDEPSDWLIIEALMKKNNIKSVDLPKIKLFLTDCDGCLTDGGMYYSEEGDELKKFNTRDGVGFALLKSENILTGIVTGEKVELNRRRFNKLKLDYLVEGCQDKLTAIKKIADENKISLENVCYIGDDLFDIDALKAVGYSACPSDACDEVKNVVKYITKAKGGEGVIREVVNKIME